MKKITSWLSILLLTGILAACNTTTGSENTSSEQPPDTEVSETTSGNTSETLEGTLVESDSQNYSITVVDGFELTGEEPNKDMLMYTANNQQSMRIETFDISEVNISDITSDVLAGIEASNEQEEAVEITDEVLLPSGEGIVDVKGFQIKTNDGNVSGYAYEKGDLIVKLTIFDLTKEPLTKTFIQMAETISSK
ncbi:hypothetical protein [Psychrobacillus sp.]|uniref:hypothetical protein n=1 Tax=Psychrobacillus sp. TaxID=1871623 RepID=UPI0028BE47B9|nr:hypothetical protein [Psychrobacillus sp.]